MLSPLLSWSKWRSLSWLAASWLLSLEAEAQATPPTLHEYRCALVTRAGERNEQALWLRCVLEESSTPKTQTPPATPPWWCGRDCRRRFRKVSPYRVEIREERRAPSNRPAASVPRNSGVPRRGEGDLQRVGVQRNPIFTTYRYNDQTTTSGHRSLPGFYGGFVQRSYTTDTPQNYINRFIFSH